MSTTLIVIIAIVVVLAILFGKRILGIGKAQGNAVLDKMQDPTKTANQMIRDMQVKLDEARTALATVKTNSLRADSDVLIAKKNLADWDSRLSGILAKIDDGDKTPETNQLSHTAAEKYDAAIKTLAAKENIAKQAAEQAKVLEHNVQHIIDAMDSAKDQASEIAARQKVADATLTINKALDTTNVDGLQGTLDKMKNKVTEKEFIAEAYANTGSAGSAATRIDEMLGSNSTADTIAAFRQKKQA